MLLFLTLILAASFAQAQDVPKRKSGLWEVKRTTVRTEGKPRINWPKACATKPARRTRYAAKAIS
jgi:hypothetical protein